MSRLLKAACIQLNSGPDVQENLKAAEILIRQAVADGAVYVLTPEVTDQVVPSRADSLYQIFTQEEHPGVAFFADLAKELSVYLCIGSMCVKADDDKVANRSFFFGPDGALLQTYDKIHLYDVDLPTGESHRESKLFHAGERMVIGSIEKTASVGMAICYDLRFPHLFRDMAKEGADILNMPAAFTVPTGKAHWEVLLRARAIETGCFVMAAAQCGDHRGARQTYGHSCIVNPWGQVITAMKEGEGYLSAELNLDEVQQARQAIPALKHDRDYGR